VWYDEEPPQDIYEEGLARLIATRGISYLTFTPLQGMSEVVSSFLNEDHPNKADVNMTIDDAEHLTEEEKKAVIESFPEHQRDARINGIPILGSGQIFPVNEESIKFRLEEFEVPGYWNELGALDFGWDHPTAAVKSYWDRDSDIIYITHAYRESQKTPLLHAEVLRRWDQKEQKLLWVWPHDGNNDTAAGKALAKQYRDHGLDMHPERVTFEDGSNSVEAGLMEMLDRMHTGRLKVASHLSEWFEEMRLYHRKNGLVVKLKDDLMSATRYNIMGLRFGRRVKPAKQTHHGARGSGWAM
jgi:hypothetical protein